MTLGQAIVIWFSVLLAAAFVIHPLIMRRVRKLRGYQAAVSGRIERDP